jgi:hypothetical protein
MGGIVSFYPDSISKYINFRKSNLIISDLRVSNEAVRRDRGTYDLDQVTLPKGTNNFQVSFVSLDFSNPEKVRYRYRLLNQQQDWIITDSKHRFISYAGLKPGRYEFQVNATNPEGNWFTRRSLVIIIPSYFYQTTGFIIFIGILSFSIVLLFILMYIHQIKLKEHRKQEQLKLESLRGQMNPHFLFNSLNSINYFISENNKIDANRYITDFSRLMRAFLTNSANEYIPLEKEIEAMEDYLRLEHLRFSDKFDYSVIIDPQLDVFDFEIAPTIVQPFVENAIWHGVRSLDNRKGIVIVRYSMTNPADNFIKCIVEDDGVGRKLSVLRKTEEQRKRRSRGISIIKERLEIINSIKRSNFKIIIEDLFPDQEETGTRVTIEVPLRKRVLHDKDNNR